MSNINVYDSLKASSVLRGDVRRDYAFIAASAYVLGYKDVYELMSDACLIFEDQTVNVVQYGSVMLYNQGAVTEMPL